MLFEDDHGPIEPSMGLIAVDLKTAAACYQSWQNEILEQYGMKNSGIATQGVTVETALESLLPLTTPIPTRFVFLGTDSRWTVFFDNFLLGTDARAPMVVMGEKLGCESLRVVRVTHTLPKNPDKHAKGRYGAMILELYAPVRTTRRAVYVANDGGKWVFGQSGTPLDFEDQDAYACKRIKDRFTADMLVDYLAKLDAKPFNEDWYNGDVVMLKKEGNLPDTMAEHY